jgi:hypothetical protein
MLVRFLLFKLIRIFEKTESGAFYFLIWQLILNMYIVQYEEKRSFPNENSWGKNTWNKFCVSA